MDFMNGAELLFYTLVRSENSKEQVQLLIKSLRAFGGELARAPILIFEANPEIVPCEDLAGPGIELLPIEAPESVRAFYYYDKVFAGASAEQFAANSIRTLVWIAPDCLILQPPVLYQLDPESDAALRPVHIQNIGLSPEEPLDAFWQGIYERIGLTDAPSTVRSFVDQQTIRAYFNSHAFSISPVLGLLRRWAAIFEALTSDAAYLAEGCSDEIHQIFLHQAILSALLSGTVPADRLRSLPAEYNYPYNLHADLPADRRARRLNDLVTIAYEGQSLDPRKMEAIEVDEPLQAWLLEHAAGLSP